MRERSGVPVDRLPGGWIFAGSVVDLDPKTEYEVKLSLKAPDGGDAEKVLKMKSIGEPKEPPGMRVRHVVPEEGVVVVLPNLNDGFQGKAPDLGALELGEPMPHFGPRK